MKQKKKLNYISIMKLTVEFKQKYFFFEFKAYTQICDMSYKNNNKKKLMKKSFFHKTIV